ncbi:IclR family transcriptional regulator [Pelagimonas varians]|uniref:Pectin degradation repressor protein KdgR n=1 Tax=Pelagimonas varians TaxID=696760 RepID=A0A238KPJ0_9RHOB|nr:IclR family transcriptional regulator [Pelagimonas varians]PYG28794.1 IclR family transcriptional regulator [Pelagimonas varians]SMX44658.1 Pectin degradation repressor protein KdgR [Pelagimonas varians]
MSSTTKTLELLAHFSTSRPEIGLSQLCRLAKRDKATTYRHLQALEETGFLERNPVSKKYRLGPIVLQLARTREATVPRKAGVEAPLVALAGATGETSHVTVLSGKTVYALASCESPRHGTRAIIDIETFPLHATASGLCALAFGPTDLMAFAQKNLCGFTAMTPTTAQELENIVGTIRATGFGCANRSYEDEVLGLSAPVFDQTGHYAGAVSVASVAARFTPDLKRIIQEHLVIAARDITRNWGGTLPPQIEEAWAKTLSHSNTLDTAS